MKLNIYAIRDTKAEAFMQPFFERTNETATRAVQTATEKDGNFRTYAEDYSLWLIGNFNDNNGKISPETAPIHLSNLVDIRDRTEAGRDGDSMATQTEDAITNIRRDIAAIESSEETWKQNPAPEDIGRWETEA